MKNVKMQAKIYGRTNRFLSLLTQAALYKSPKQWNHLKCTLNPGEQPYGLGGGCSKQTGTQTDAEYMAYNFRYTTTSYKLGKENVLTST